MDQKNTGASGGFLHQFPSKPMIPISSL